MKLTKDEQGELECRLDYGIKCHVQAMTDLEKMKNCKEFMVNKLVKNQDL